MFEQKMKSAIANAVRLGLENGMDIEKAISETLDLAHSGNLPSELKTNSCPIVKNFLIKSAEVDIEERTVSGYISTWDIDQVDDIIHKGAFLKSINERFPLNKIKFLSQHDTLIGKPLEMYEDDNGVFVKAYISQTTRGNDDLQLVKDGALDCFSIGFSIPGGKYEIDEKGVRHIYEVKLLEFSLVTFPANEAAKVVDIKNQFKSNSEGNISESNKNAQEAQDAQDVQEAQEAQDVQYAQDAQDAQDKIDQDKLDIADIEKSIKDLHNFSRLRLY